MCIGLVWLRISHWNRFNLVHSYYWHVLYSWKIMLNWYSISASGSMYTYWIHKYPCAPSPVWIFEARKSSCTSTQGVKHADKLLNEELVRWVDSDLAHGSKPLLPHVSSSYFQISGKFLRIVKRRRTGGVKNRKAKAFHCLRVVSCWSRAARRARGPQRIASLNRGDS